MARKILTATLSLLTIGVAGALTAVPAVAVAPDDPITSLHDFDGDGDADLITRDAAGRLVLHPGDGTGTIDPTDGRLLGIGFRHAVLIPAGDVDDDGKNDLLGVHAGTMWLYRGDGAGHLARPVGHLVSNGWARFDELVAADVDGDGYEDLYALDRARGQVVLYLGREGVAFSPPRLVISSGARSWDQLTVLDLDADGALEMLVRDTRTGRLLDYPLRADGTVAVQGLTIVGTGWNPFHDLAVLGDFAINGRTEVFGITRGGVLLRYDARTNGSLGRAADYGALWGPVPVTLL